MSWRAFRENLCSQASLGLPQAVGKGSGGQEGGSQPSGGRRRRRRRRNSRKHTTGSAPHCLRERSLLLHYAQRMSCKSCHPAAQASSHATVAWAPPGTGMLHIGAALLACHRAAIALATKTSLQFNTSVETCVGAQPQSCIERRLEHSQAQPIGSGRCVRAQCSNLDESLKAKHTARDLHKTEATPNASGRPTARPARAELPPRGAACMPPMLLGGERARPACIVRTSVLSSRGPMLLRCLRPMLCCGAALHTLLVPRVATSLQCKPASRSARRDALSATSRWHGGGGSLSRASTAAAVSCLRTRSVALSLLLIQPAARHPTKHTG